MKKSITHCDDCGCELKSNSRRKYNLCKKCRMKKYNKTYEVKQKICIVCGEKKRPHTRRSDGEIICDMCVGKKMEICFVCSKEKKVYGRTSDGKAICCVCRNTTTGICSNCQKVGQISIRGEDGLVICRSCYIKDYEQPKKMCCKCGEIKRVNNNTIEGPVCSSCCVMKKRMCEECKKIKKVAIIVEDKDYCCVCYNNIFRRKILCNICKKERAKASNDADFGDICHTCYRNLKSKRDNGFCIEKRLRWNLWHALLKYSINGKIKKSQEYGINYKQIADHLGNKPDENIKYHIDHIIPLHMFDFNNLDHIKYAFLPENHRWLPAEQNLMKGGKCSKERFDKYIKLVSSGIIGEELLNFLLDEEEK